MNPEFLMLIAEAFIVYFLVLFTHSLRRRFGPAHFYALLGGLTAVMSWITDSGASVEAFGITFLVGSSVFYTSLLLGIFVVYVFEGPPSTRIAISIVAGVSIIVPLITLVLHLQFDSTAINNLRSVPFPSARVNIVSVVTTVIDMFFLAMVWDFLGKPRLQMKLWMRAFLTLLGVMWLDVILFNTGAFLGRPEYSGLIQGALLSRLVISAAAFPLLYLYMSWQNSLKGVLLENRPVLSILKDAAKVRAELHLAKKEITHRLEIEQENKTLIGKLTAALVRVQKLEGLMPICSNCRRIRIDSAEKGGLSRWVSVENYLYEESAVKLSHGVCPDCLEKVYPDVSCEEKTST
jgi:uncharacterized PurR-regulated membrane protein YhhQ (DUF165 family)